MVVTNEVRNTRAESYFSNLDMWSSVQEMVSIFQNAEGPWKLMFWTPIINWKAELCLEVKATLFFWDHAQSLPERNTTYWQSFVLKALEESVYAALGRLAMFVSAAVTNVCCHIFPKGTTSQAVNSGKRARKLLAFLFKQFSTFCDCNTPLISAQLGNGEVSPGWLTVSRLVLLCPYVMSLLRFVTAF